MGEAHEVVSNTEHITAELEVQLGLSPEVQPAVEPDKQESGATAYPDEDSILLDAPQSFFSIENYEKSILA